MKVVILAGGLGTRLSEETVVKPKPMVEVGGKPILLHIMARYYHYGFKDFVIACGYKQEYILDYFVNQTWNINAVFLDTGLETNTGGRIKRCAEHIGNKPFLLTYGDGVGTINIPDTIRFHTQMERLVTVTAVHPPARFGNMIVSDGEATSFMEKSQMEKGYINGGFFIVEPEAINYIHNDDTSWEYEALPRLAKDGQLAAYKHEGFWQCMDTMHDVRTLNQMYEDGAPWLK